MIKKAIYNLLLVSVIGAAIAGCSDNVDDNLVPIEMSRTLAVRVVSEMYSNGKLSLGAASSATEVTVESNTRWSVEIGDCEGGWCEVYPTTGTGNGIFTITVRDNSTELRNCYVRVYKTNAKGEKELSGSQEIIVSQTMSTLRISPLSLEPFPAKDAPAQLFQIVSNVPWSLTVSSNTDFISVTPVSGTMEPDNSGYKGTGDAQFSITLADNVTAAERMAYLELTGETGRYTIEIRQLKPDNIFDVSPTEQQIIPASGGQIEFGILSLSDWTVSSSATWITFNPTSGTGGNNRSVTVASAAPNNSLNERSAEINFRSSYGTKTVKVIQRGFDLTFTVSPAETLGEISCNGGEKHISIDSRFDWELNLPDWITADKTSGTASLVEQSVTLVIARSTLRDARHGTIVIVPKATEFSGGVNLDPGDLGIDPLRLSITQAAAELPSDRPSESDNPTPSN